MEKSKEITHQNIIKAAKEEFLTYGFNKASMRHIGNKIGITQAALYKHYKNKEDMFVSLVQPAIDHFTKLAKEHERLAYENIDNPTVEDFLSKNNDVTLFKEMISKYKDEYKLILCCSQGTRYENFINDLVEVEVESTYKAIKYIANKNNKEVTITKDELHLILSAYMTAIFEPIVHDWPIEKALHGLNKIEEFFIPGFKKIMDL